MDKLLVPFQACTRLPGARLGVIAPHPDDEVFGCGGLLSLMRDCAVIKVVVLSNGEKQAGQTETARQEESRKAAEYLGLEPPSFWGFADGHLREASLREPIAKWLDENQFDLLLCPSPWEVHPDHRAVAETCIELIKAGYKTPERLAFYEVGMPMAEASHLVDVSSVYSRKLMAMESFSSQLSYQSYTDKIVGLNRYRTYTLSDETRYAEAYLVLSAEDLYQQDFLAPQALSRAMQRAENEILEMQQTLAKTSQEGGEHWDNLQLAQNEILRLDQALARASSEGGEHWDNLQKAIGEIHRLESEVLEHREKKQSWSSEETRFSEIEQNLQALEEKNQRLEQERALAQQALEELTTQLQLTQTEKAAALQALEDVFRSRSWRLTRPFRGFAQLVRSPQRFFRRAAKAMFHSPVTPHKLRTMVRQVLHAIETKRHSLEDSPNNAKSLAVMLKNRNEFASRVAHGQAIAPLNERPYQGATVDVTVVTYNSESHLTSLFESLLKQSIPRTNISLFFVDHGSSDKSVEKIQTFKKECGQAFRGIELLQQDNLGFGAGHDRAAQRGNAPYILVCNPDIVLHACALERVLGLAQSDHEDIAAWELRQQPYEHPKHYDPVTWETSWTSHACVLLRRDALAKVGGFDTRIFLYGEDVELSYRLRSVGYRLRYCPNAVAFHNTYTEAHEVKPEQYIGSQTASVYLRLRFGSKKDLAAVPWFIAAMLIRPSPFWGARMRLFKRLVNQVARHSLRLIKEQRAMQVQGIFPFRGFDYELRREGAFVNQPNLTEQLNTLPLVSVLTRTVEGRASLLAQAGYSVLQQTYPNIEWLVVEDGGDTQRHLVQAIAASSSRKVRYEALEPSGRSNAGNRALSLARGDYCLFLDDDDLLYADHIESLMMPLLQKPSAAAAYGLCWCVESDFNENREVVSESQYTKISAHETEFDAKRLEFENFLPIQAVVFARRLFVEKGGFNTTLDALEDWNLWRRYSVGETFMYVAKTTSLYRVPSDSQKKEARQKTLDEAYLKVKALSDEEVRLLLTTIQVEKRIEAPIDHGDCAENTEPALLG